MALTQSPEGSRDGDEKRIIYRSPGDVLFSPYALPVTDAIVYEARSRGPKAPDGVFLSFPALRKFLEFLELVVITERLVLPVAQYSKETSRVLEDEDLALQIDLFRLPGSLDYSTEDLVDRLADAGILTEAVIQIGESTADALVKRLLPSSKSMRAQLKKYKSSCWGNDEISVNTVAEAMLAVRVGAPLHVAEAASLSTTPYVLGGADLQFMSSVEREHLHARDSIGHHLLARLSAKARAELSPLAELGVLSVFPETPLASMILAEASTPAEMVEVALRLRSELRDFRSHLSAIEADLADESVPLKKRLARAKELQLLADDLWPEKRNGVLTSATGVAEALLAIPELAVGLTPALLKKAVSALRGSALDRVVALWRRRRIRVFAKSRKTMLSGASHTEQIAKIFSVSPETVAFSRRLEKRS